MRWNALREDAISLFWIETIFVLVAMVTLAGVGYVIAQRKIGHEAALRCLLPELPSFLFGCVITISLLTPPIDKYGQPILSFVAIVSIVRYWLAKRRDSQS
jgi:hypothetical protein